jgi:predicted RNase H-like HicB family nuclease
MNREAILKTAIAHWKPRDKCYVVSSPLLENFIGAGDDEQEAWRLFREAVDAAYLAYLEGRVVGGQYKTRGRPPKYGEDLHTKVKPATKKLILRLARELGGISIGEVIDYLVSLQQAQRVPVKSTHKRKVG